jgi:Mg2+/Co2+ transporter CorB
MLDFIFYSAVIVLLYLSSLLFNLEGSNSAFSEYELKRRARDGDKMAKRQAWLKKHADDVSLSLKLLGFILQAAFILILQIKTGKVWPALVLSLIAFMVMRYVNAAGMFKKMFNFWERILAKIGEDLVLIFKHPLKPLFIKKTKDAEPKKSYYSEEEFAYRFAIDSDVLSEVTRTKIDRMLKGGKAKAKDVMMSISAVPKVDVNLSLTPIIYDELHQKGFDMALVFQGSEDNLVGLLHLSESEAVEQLNSSSQVRVGDKMEQGMQYVKEDVKLDDLVSGFLKGGQNAILVTGSGGLVSGVITARKLLAWVSGA